MQFKVEGFFPNTTNISQLGKRRIIFKKVPAGRGDINFLCWTGSTPNLLHEPVFVAWDSRSQQNVKHVILVVTSKHLGLGGMLSFRIQLKSRIFGSFKAQHAEHSPVFMHGFCLMFPWLQLLEKDIPLKKDHGFVECFSTWAIQEGCPLKTNHTSTTCLESEHYHFNIPQPKLTAYHNQISNHSMFEKPLHLQCVNPDSRHGSTAWGGATLALRGAFRRRSFETIRGLGWLTIRRFTPKSSQIRENWISIWMPLQSFTTKKVNYKAGYKALKFLWIL